MKVYLAASYPRCPEMKGYAAELAAAGHVCTARWVTEREFVEADDGLQGTCVSTEFDGTEALIDVHDVEYADALVAFTGGAGRGGRHVEFGMAIAWGKRLLLVGEPEHIFHHLSVVERYPTWAAALAALTTEICPDAAGTARGSTT